MKIAIVNDLKVSCELLKRIITSRPDFSVPWIAYNGLQAVSLAKSDPPDLILMDLVMPEKTGVEAIQEIMQSKPCPILIVSACIDSSMSMVFEAMGAGALDVVSTPSITNSGDIQGATELLNKVTNIRLLVDKLHYKPDFTPIPHSKVLPSECPPLLLFGASTGGPTAITSILRKLNKPLLAACVIVQHVDSDFIQGFIHWLEEQTGYEVRLAEPGDTPEMGKVYIANTRKNLVMTENRTFSYSLDENDSAYIPSIDTFFKSTSIHWGKPGVATLLTGMGGDGGEGLLALKEKGWHTIAEDESTCVVYGMPKKAVELGAANELVPLRSIPQLILNQLNKLQMV